MQGFDVSATSHLNNVINTVLYELHGHSLLFFAIKVTLQIFGFEMGCLLPDFEAVASVIALIKGTDLLQCYGNCQ